MERDRDMRSVADRRVSARLAAAWPMLKWSIIMIDPNQQVAQIVIEHPETATIFQRLTIDFCCHGHKRLDEACAEVGYNAIAVLRELDAAISARARKADDPRGLSTPALLQYIVTKHHDYLRTALPTVVSLASKVAAVHGMRDARLYDLASAVRELSDAMLPHIDEEEAVLFPAMRAEPPDRMAITGMLEAIESEHQEVGVLLATIREAANDYVEPEWACRTYRTLFSELVRLEADTLRHVHLENHVLAPRFGGVS
jgi:regulator of cell morphogenesis and NO signaling